MTTPRRDLTGERLGRLTVTEQTDRVTAQGSVIWSARCDCGALRDIPSRYFVPSERHRYENAACAACSLERRRKRMRSRSSHARRLRRRVDPKRDAVFGELMNVDVDAMHGLAPGTTAKRLVRGWDPRDCLEIGRSQR